MERVRRDRSVAPFDRAIEIETKKDEAKPIELPSGWRELAALEPGKLPTRTAILAQLPVLLGQATLDREVAHRAVHAVVMGLAAGRWGKEGASLTTDRVLHAIDEIDRVMASIDRVDVNFEESYQRFRLLAMRALDHCGPAGLFGPSSIYGPLDNHPSSPSSLYPNFQMYNLLGKWSAAAGDVDRLKRTGEHGFEFLPGGALAFVGPSSALKWALGSTGNNGPLSHQRFVEGGAWSDAFGKTVTKVASSGEEQPLYEIYGEAFATKEISKDAFFGVEGTAKKGDTDAYRFETSREQWVTAGCSQVTPGRRFTISLYDLDSRREIDRSDGIAGPAGIHVKVPAGRYELVVKQLDPDPSVPELNEHPVGKRLGPALMRHREAWGSVFPEAVDREAERDPNRYRLYVSGAPPDDPALPDRDQIRAGLASSALQERTLETIISLLEQTVRTLEGFQTFFTLTTPPPVTASLALLGVYPFIGPPDRSDPSASSDPTIERFMRATSRLDQLFYQGKLAQWIETALPAVMEPLKIADANLRAIGLPGLVLPRTVANHGDL